MEDQVQFVLCMERLVLWLLMKLDISLKKETFYFPYNVKHYVSPFLSKCVRISVAANYTIDVTNEKQKAQVSLEAMKKTKFTKIDI